MATNQNIFDDLAVSSDQDNQENEFENEENEDLGGYMMSSPDKKSKKRVTIKENSKIESKDQQIDNTIVQNEQNKNDYNSNDFEDEYLDDEFEQENSNQKQQNEDKQSETDKNKDFQNEFQDNISQSNEKKKQDNSIQKINSIDNIENENKIDLKNDQNIETDKKAKDLIFNLDESEDNNNEKLDKQIQIFEKNKNDEEIIESRIQNNEFDNKDEDNDDKKSEIQVFGDLLEEIDTGSQLQQQQKPKQKGGYMSNTASQQSKISPKKDKKAKTAENKKLILEQQQNQIQRTKIKIILRVRPLINYEVHADSVIEPDQNNNTVSFIDRNHIKETTFFKVFGAESQQIEVFQVIKESIQQVFQGYNFTILAYGQTGSGKTFTMFGADWEQVMQPSSSFSDKKKAHNKQKKQQTIVENIENDNNLSGIIPRTIHQLFKEIEELDQEYNQKFKVYCSFFQIYNEKVYDLLTDSDQNLPVRTNLIDGVFIDGLLEYKTEQFYDTFLIMQRGEKNRKIRDTRMNTKSSRSHTVFQISIEQVSTDESGIISRSRIHLCDLAGSEKINKQEVMSNEHMKELQNINQSLTTLGKVVHNLSHKTKMPIPFRESKLTRILQESLGGNSQTFIVGNMSPSIYNLSESLSTLKFLERARNITQNIKQNQYDKGEQDLVHKLQREVQHLKDILGQKRTGNYTDIKMNQNIQLKLMYLEEENQKLKQEQYQNLDIQQVIKENNKLKYQLAQLKSGKNNNIQNSALLESKLQQTQQQLQQQLNKISQSQKQQKQRENLYQEDKQYHKENKLPSIHGTSPHNKNDKNNTKNKEAINRNSSLNNSEFSKIPKNKNINSDIQNNISVISQSNSMLMIDRKKYQNLQKDTEIDHNPSAIKNAQVVTFKQHDFQIRVKGDHNKELKQKQNQIHEAENQRSTDMKRILERLNNLQSIKQHNKEHLQQELERIKQQQHEKFKRPTPSKQKSVHSRYNNDQQAHSHRGDKTRSQFSTSNSTQKVTKSYQKMTPKEKHAARMLKFQKELHQIEQQFPN